MKTYTILAKGKIKETIQTAHQVMCLAMAAEALKSINNYTVMDEQTATLHNLEKFLKKYDK